MEQHPVPQNVTTFQFRLIGDMTIKQFGFLAGGAILGYICYKLPLPFFFTYPLAAISVMTGVGFAFVPIEDRPMDVWVLSFFKSAYRPTQYLWMINPNTAPTPLIISSPPAPATNQSKGSSLFDQITRIFSPTPPSPAVASAKAGPPTDGSVVKHQDPIQSPIIAQPQAPANPPPTPPPPPRSSKTEADVTRLTEQLKVMQGEMQSKSLTEARVVELQKQLTELLNEKSHLQNELISLKKHSTLIPSTAPPVGSAQAVNPSQTIKVVSQDRATGAGLPHFTNHPNIITGIVKDTDNNLLPGVLVTVRDTQDVPLRALKTNKLGQFAASTPLSNGTYLVEVEDPRSRYIFDRAQLTLNGTVVPTIEIIAKNAKILAREKLSKELFENQVT